MLNAWTRVAGVRQRPEMARPRKRAALSGGPLEPNYAHPHAPIFRSFRRSCTEQPTRHQDQDLAVLPSSTACVTLCFGFLKHHTQSNRRRVEMRLVSPSWKLPCSSISPHHRRVSLYIACSGGPGKMSPPAQENNRSGSTPAPRQVAEPPWPITISKAVKRIKVLLFWKNETLI